VNPVTGTSWLWRALRGKSVTFAALFACGVLGLSIVGEFRHLLSRLGAPWYVWLILPMIAVAVLARKESEWLPDVDERRKWSKRLVFGSIILSLVIAKFHRTPSPPSAPSSTAPQRQGRAQVEHP
jgi:hypothetical protein